MFRDRLHAGQELAELLKPLNLKHPLVLAIPRGGVVVGHQVALGLQADLDVVLAKKIGAPFNPEFAVAAVDQDGHVTFPPSAGTYASQEYIQDRALDVSKQIARQLDYFRQGRKPVEPKGRHVVVVDDGLATGLTALAAIKYVRRLKPSKLVLAVPVSPRETLDTLAQYVDQVVCVDTPAPFYAVGQWYARFDQVDDDTVRQILAQAQSR